MGSNNDPRRALTELLVSVVNSREEEFARVARVLHDEVGQVLSAVGLQLDVLRLDFKDHVPDIVERTAEIQAMLERAVCELRDLSHQLNPAIVERTGLQYALDRLVGRYGQSFPNPLRLLYDPSARFPQNVAVALYKIADRALDNAVRHARAGMIELQVKQERDAALLEVRDNGAGFDVARAREMPATLGLRLMDYYAGQAGLALKVASRPGEGTIVRATWERVATPDKTRPDGG